MFSVDSFTCSVIAGFFPLVNSPADCNWEFAASTAVGGIASFIFRYKHIGWLMSLFGGVGAYYVSLCTIQLVSLTITPPSTNQEQLGWFLFLCILLIPRAFLASALGLLLREAFFLVKKTLHATRHHG